MKPTTILSRINPSRVILSRQSRLRALLVLGLALGAAFQARTADITWTNTATSGSLFWTTASNWSPNTVPTDLDNVIIENSTYAYIDLPNNNNPVNVGSITIPSTRVGANVVLRQQSSSAPIVIHGINGVLITNISTAKRLQIAQNGVAAPTLYLANSGDIFAPSGIEVLFYTGIRETNGSFGFTKTGPGTLTFQTPAGNLHTGPTTIKEGTIDLRLSTARLGSGGIYLSGGTLLAATDRSSVTPQAGPVVVTADSTIQGNGNRVFPFSGTFSGDAGTLTIRNGGASGSTFAVRLTGGGFDFTRPIVFLNSTYGSIAALQLQNPASAGTQTFSGTISPSYPGGDPCRVERGGADGTTIFKGDNTYEGGTIISQGTLLANNTTGSALGSGTVTVTNLGILGGSGTIQAETRPAKGGAISPGATASSIGNLRISSLIFGEGAVYNWQITSATGVPGTAWDLITCDFWGDAASSTDTVTIKVDSMGATPAGWNAGIARDWVILQTTSSGGFTPLNFALNTTAFSGQVAGTFALYVDGTGSLHLTYTPLPDLVINVAAGTTKTQTEAGYATLTGATQVAKVGEGELILDNGYNDYQGATKVLAGTLTITTDAANGMGALGVSSAATQLGNTTGSSNATFNINTANVLMSRDIVVQAGSTGTKTIGTTVASGNVSYSGNVTLNDSAILSAPTGGAITFSGNFSGDGGITLSGGGAFTLSGIGTYKGPTLVNTPLLNLNGPAFGTNTITFDTAVTGLTLDNTSGDPVTLNTARQSWNGNIEFIGTGSLNLGAGEVALSGNRQVNVDAGTLTVGGTITGNGSLTKTGAGQLYLAGASASSYSGGTTNAEGELAISSTATFGDGTGTLALNGGSLLFRGSHAALANPVLLGADSVLVGTNNASMSVAFAAPFANPGGHKLTIANKGFNTTIFGVRLYDGGNITWPIVVGDSAYDRPAGGVTNQIEFYSTSTTPQIVSGLISSAGTGKGAIVRANATPNTGGATIFTGQNTVGGAFLTGGAIGFGASSVVTEGVITSGPIGTGLFTIGNQTTSETNMTVFAHGGPRVIDNPIFLNGAQNVNITGDHNLTLNGAISAGGIGKKWTVWGSGIATLNGVITASGAGAPLTKDGPGTLALGADNQYWGATTVQQGTLLAVNTTGSATGTNTVTVRSGATLGGTGIVAGPVTTTSGNVGPGQNGAGTLTLAGGVNLSDGGTYIWDLAANSTDPGSFDVLSVTGGNVVLGGTSQIQVNFTGVATAPDPANPFWQSTRSWTVLTVGGSAVNPGPTTFGTVVNGVYQAAGRFTTAADGSGNIVLTFTPGVTPDPVISGTVADIETGSPTLTWSAVDGLKYRLQYTTNLYQPTWLTVGDVTAIGATASMTHTNSVWPQCFYRVIIP